MFAAVMVLFADRDAAVRTESAIGEALVTTGVKPEFKFSKCSNSTRDAFFAAVDGCDFAVRAIVVDKSLIYSPHLRVGKESFYRFFIKSMMKFDNGVLKNATIIIDGSGERAFRQDLSAHLRRHTAAGAIKTVKFKDSRRDRLVQLADMCVGAIARSYQVRDNADRWRRMLAPKIEDVWEFE